MATSVSATRITSTGVERIHVLQKTPGAFYLLDYLGVPDVELIFSCPCGCGRLGKVDLKPHYIVKEATHRLYGEDDALDLDQDVSVMDAPPPNEVVHWRGRLEEGQWIKAR